MGTTYVKNVSVILLSFVLLASTFDQVVIQGVFRINRDYIARTLCVNKDKPVLHCNGMCFMARKLREQEKQEQQAPNLKREKFDIDASVMLKRYDLPLLFPHAKPLFYTQDDAVPSALLRPVFHPPGV